MATKKDLLDSAIFKVKNFLTQKAAQVASSPTLNQFAQGVQNVKQTPLSSMIPFSPTSLQKGYQSANALSSYFKMQSQKSNVPGAWDDIGRTASGMASKLTKVASYPIKLSQMGSQDIVSGIQNKNPLQAVKGAGEFLGGGAGIYYGANLLAKGGIKGILGRGITGAGIGLGMGGVGQVVTGGGLPTKQQAMGYIQNGIENSWTLAITNAVTDEVLSKIAPNLVGDALTAPFKTGQVRGGLKQVFTRALAEVPAENTAFTWLDRLNEESQTSFMQDWMKNLPGNILSNLVFAAGQGTWNMAINKESRKAISDGFSETVRKWNTPVTTMKLDKDGKRITVPMWEYKIKKNQPGLTTKDINELSVEDYAKIQPKGVGGVEPLAKGDMYLYRVHNKADLDRLKSKGLIANTPEEANAKILEAHPEYRKEWEEAGMLDQPATWGVNEQETEGARLFFTKSKNPPYEGDFILRVKKSLADKYSGTELTEDIGLPGEYFYEGRGNVPPEAIEIKVGNEWKPLTEYQPTQPKGVGGEMLYRGVKKGFPNTGSLESWVTSDYATAQKYAGEGGKVLEVPATPELLSKLKYPGERLEGGVKQFQGSLSYNDAKKLGIDDFNIAQFPTQPKGVGVTKSTGSTLEVKPTEISAKVGKGITLETNQQGKMVSSRVSEVQQTPSSKQISTQVSSKGQVSTSQPILSLPKPKYEVSTSKQMKKILAKDPNADVRIVLKPGKTTIILPDGPIPTRQEVAGTLPNRINNFIDNVLGYKPETPKGGTKKASLYTRKLRAGQESITRKVEAGLGSENTLVRNAAATLQNFFRGLGMSPERAQASMELKGGIGVANERAYNVMDSLYKVVGNDKVSLERINAVLDPELAKTKVKFGDLTPAEKQTYNLIREGLDLVHDTSYANGHISEELYIKNKGSYTPRLYDVMELPEEVNKFIRQGRKINNDLYKQRTEVTDWKVENSLNDPVYALGKRLSQVETNKAIKKYTDFLASNSRFVSDVERPGFTKLEASPAYGQLSGRWVLNSAAEDLKGFFFSTNAMQNIYDVFRAYDRLAPRQLQKKLLTVFNPTTNVGNIVSDQVFGFVTGVDPLTLNKNLIEFKNNPQQYKQLSDYLMSKGIIGNDITRTDFVSRLGQIDELAKNKKVGLGTKITKFYGGTDDVYKASAFKALIDKGFTLEEATRKVADGFQNYSNVGKFYDVWAKTPVLGSAFIKFQGDLIRIIKNGAVNNPLGLITFLGALEGVALLSSKLSGEPEEDYKTRTERFAAPMIPGLKIPLTWQTPYGEINVARYISPFYANNETTDMAKMLPFVPTINKDKDVASNIAINANDPLLAPLVQLGVNRDFRGKPISDPKENKYQKSTLTPAEKLWNRTKFTGRAYTPPPINSLIDVGVVSQGGKDMYGRTQTTGQALARVGGIKVTQFGAKEAEESRQRDLEYQQYGNEDVQKQINSVYKQFLNGDITQKQRDARVENLEKQKVAIGSISSSGSKYRYIRESDGSMQTIDVSGINNLKTDTKQSSDVKDGKVVSVIDDIILNLSQEDQAKALEELGVERVSEDTFIYKDKAIYIEDGSTKTIDLDFTFPQIKQADNILLAEEYISDFKGELTEVKKNALKAFDKELISQDKLMDVLTTVDKLKQALKKPLKAKKPKQPKFIPIKFGKTKKVSGITKKKAVKLVRAKKIKTPKL